ncbi:Fe-S oxidoreductase [Actinomyces minihominis]|uniref:Fe-S oxidoreductase n=1 Tax=Actinomyces minihominis TaxID=2002838 RepID=UPI000C07B3D5|nr:Fe-S oxidoreductase [Actinomyces minihominis]
MGFTKRLGSGWGVLSQSAAQPVPVRSPWQPAHPGPRGLLRAQELAGRFLFDRGIGEITTEVISAVAVGYAAFFPGVRFLRDDDLVIASRLPGWAYPRGGICLGRVFLTGTSFSRSVLVHEKRHVAQWRRYGPWFPLLYAISGRSAHRNWFEVEAGLEDGGYLRSGRAQGVASL